MEVGQRSQPRINKFSRIQYEGSVHDQMMAISLASRTFSAIKKSVEAEEWRYADYLQANF